MAKRKNPFMPGDNKALDALYVKLGALEEKEIHAIELGNMNVLAQMRKQMLPLKRQINKIEGVELYPEANMKKNPQDLSAKGYGGPMKLKGYDPDMYEKGYSCAQRFTYIPDFKNEREKASFEAGYKEGKKPMKKNPYKKYLVSLSHDAGNTVLEVIASSPKSAKEMVMRTEGCPASAILKVSPSPTGRKRVVRRKNPSRSKNAAGPWRVFVESKGKMFAYLGSFTNVKMNGETEQIDRFAPTEKFYTSPGGKAPQYKVSDIKKFRGLPSAKNFGDNILNAPGVKSVHCISNSELKSYI